MNRAKCWDACWRGNIQWKPTWSCPFPDSGVPAAIGFALESKIPFRMGLIRNHYIGRTFIEPSQAIRNFGVKLKLNPVRSLIAGKRVVLVDDSIVRGTTSRKLVRMMREAGAKEVHMRISCPPTDFAVLLRRGHADEGRTDCLLEYAGGDSQVFGRGFAGIPVVARIAASGERHRREVLHRLAIPGIYPTDLVQLEVRENGSAKLKRRSDGGT